MRHTKPPRVPWVAEQVAARGEVTVLYGPAGISKSLFCLGLCDAVARGNIFAGIECNRGSSLYFDAENGEFEVHRRVRSLGISPKRLEIFDATGTHLVDHYGELEETVASRKGAKLVVLDSLRRLVPGTEENDSSDMADALGMCKTLAQRQKVAVLVIHHARKDGSAYRGSSAIADQTSILYRLEREEKDLDRLRRTLTNEKMRVAEEPGPYCMRIGFEAGVFVAEATASPVDQELASGIAPAQLAPQIIRVLSESRRNQSRIARALGRKPSDGTVRRALGDLEKAGQVIKASDGAWEVVAKGKLPRQPQSGKESKKGRKRKKDDRRET
jgi:hypothetical protein